MEEFRNVRFGVRTCTYVYLPVASVKAVGENKELESRRQTDRYANRQANMRKAGLQTLILIGRQVGRQVDRL